MGTNYILHDYMHIKTDIEVALSHIQVAQETIRLLSVHWILLPLFALHQELIRLSNSVVCLTIHEILFAIIINGEWRQISLVGNAFFAHGYTHQALSDDTFGIEYGFITRHTVGQQFH